MSLFKNVAVAVTVDWSFTVGSVIDTTPLDGLTVTPFGKVSTAPHVVPDFLTVIIVSAF